MMSESFIKEVVEEVLRKEAREEAFQILTIGSKNSGDWEKPLKDVEDYYKMGESGYNIVCMALDFVKHKLVNANLMEQKVGDHFGAIDWMFNLENDNTEEE